ncbi:hypothetical protein J6P92_08720 [bacterium]|nr:hypothetical protein [bacterium]
MNKIFMTLLCLLFFTQTTGGAVENKIKFDGETYHLSNPDAKSEKYFYLLKDENMGNWHSKITIEHIIDKANKTEASAEFAHEIQSQTPGASVLVYPDAGTVGYLTYPENKDFYEYNTVVFKNNEGLGLKKIQYSKRFYALENNGAENARLKAIEFAEDNNKKYMEMLNKS